MNKDSDAKVPRVMVVDDDARYCEQLAAYLEHYGCFVRLVVSPRDFDRAFKDFTPDLVVLDQRLGTTTGTEILRTLRIRHATPCIMVTGVSNPTDRIVNLEMGADDEVDKSVPPRELLARIRAVLRRYGEGAAPAGRADAPASAAASRWRLLAYRRELRRPDGSLCRLTTAEFETLRMLVQNTGSPVSRATISEIVFGRKFTSGDRAVDTVIRKIRRKIAPGAEGRFIQTYRNLGYVFVAFPE